MHLCPRCSRANPDAARFCHHDGISLRADAPDLPPLELRWAREWAFPSGRQCGTFEELAAAALVEWDFAREALRSGALDRFFDQIGHPGVAHGDGPPPLDPDVRLQTFLEALPVAAPPRPSLDLNPRRLLVTDVRKTNSRRESLRVFNRGPGLLHGTIRVVEGESWLRLGDPGGASVPLKTRREQTVVVTIDPAALLPGGSYLGKLRVESNGGTLEVPVQADVVGDAAAFNGLSVGSPRELAKLMHERSKDAIAWLEDGTVEAWFRASGFPYPLEGPLAPGTAGVQQFFEALGVSKVPNLGVSEESVSVVCVFPEAIRRAVTVYTDARKWVYAFAESDSYWLKPLEGVVAGPREVEVPFEVDSSLLSQGGQYDGTLTIAGNGGQRLVVAVHVDVHRGHEPFTRRLLRPFF